MLSVRITYPAQGAAPVPGADAGTARPVPASPPTLPPGRGLMDTRDWPIRAKLTALVVTPVAALLALWIFATT